MADTQLYTGRLTSRVPHTSEDRAVPSVVEMSRLVDELLSAGAWPERPVRMTASGPATAGEPVLSMPALAEALTYTQLPDRLFSMAIHGRQVDPGAYRTQEHTLDGAKVTDLITRGASLQLYHAHRWLPSVARACNHLANRVGHEVRAVLFVTPPREQGLGLHSDGHDVLVTQVHGSKRWWVYEADRRKPATRTGVSSDEAGEPLVVTDLRPGDLLYVPRGCPHQAMSLDSSSTHISIVLRPRTVAETLLEQCRALLDNAEFDVALPPRPADRADQLDELLRAARERIAGLLVGPDAGPGRSPVSEASAVRPTELSERWLAALTAQKTRQERDGS